MSSGTHAAAVRKVEQIVAVQAGGDGLYLVYTTYAESDAMNAVGQVIQCGLERTGGFQSILNTNDTLIPIWRSAEGRLWIGSARGNVWTTSEVEWPPSRMKGLTFNSTEQNWRVTTLPKMEGLGYTPNVTAIWGADDKNVVAGTFKGGIYMWNGIEWRQLYSATRSAINHIHGSGHDDIYAVGENGVVLHFDGHTWRQIPYPDNAGGSDGLTGVRAVNKDEVFICGRAGRVLHGNRNGLEVLNSFATPFYGIAHFQGRLILAAGDNGAWELEGSEARTLKGNFSAVGVFEAGSMLIFTEAHQEPARIVEYNPSSSSPWWRRTFPTG